MLNAKLFFALNISAITDIPKQIFDKIFAKKELSEETREELETLYTLIALGLLMGSLLIGMIKGNTAFWILSALASVFFLMKAFPNVWKMSSLIVIIYSFGGFGGFLLSRGEIPYLIVGAICEVIGIYFIFFFRSTANSLRIQLKKDVPIGIWFLSLFLLFGLANLSFAIVSFWIDKKFPRIPYTTAYISIEILIIFLGIYQLSFLQRKVVRGKIPLKKIEYEKCPICKTDMVKEVRKCPNCNEEEIVYWCLIGEHFIVNCKECNEKTVVGKNCINCGKEVAKNLTCESCQKSFPISFWKKE